MLQCKTQNLSYEFTVKYLTYNIYKYILKKNGETMETLYGITRSEDRKAEEYVYSIGQDGKIPLVLLTLLASRKKESAQDFFDLVTYEEQAKTQVEQLHKANPDLLKEVEKIVEIFEERDPVSQKRISDEWKKQGGIPVFDSSQHNEPPEDIAKYIEEYPRDTVLHFGIYARQLAKYVNMLKYEGAPQVASMSYIAFWSRKEFQQVEQAIAVAFNSVIQDIVRIMKLRGIQVDEKNLTVSMPNYKAISFREYMYPGF